MFAYCGNNAISRVDICGSYYSRTEIHNFVVKHICATNPGLSGSDTYVIYNSPFTDRKGEHIYGFCDIYCLETGEVWEVKRYGGGASCSLEHATRQLLRYTSGTLASQPELKLQTGGTETKIPASTFVVPDNEGDGYYNIAYWDDGDGIIYYDYYYTHSRNEAVDPVLLSVIGIIIWGIFTIVTSGAGAAIPIPA